MVGADRRTSVLALVAGAGDVVALAGACAGVVGVAAVVADGRAGVLAVVASNSDGFAGRCRCRRPK